ncbi:MAG: ornithine carbamoyltransferase [Candidatus Thorarchaeota archaeon]
MAKLRHRHLLSLADFTTEDYKLVFNTAKTIHKKRRDGWPHKPLEDRILALVFEKRSTRTRASFYAAMTHLGGTVVEYPESVLHVGEGHESAKDTARALGLYVSCMVMRTYQQSKVELYSDYAGVPVINGLTDEYHPCQILADLLSLEEVFGDIQKITLAYLGRPNNITNTLIQSCSVLGFSLKVGYPEDLQERYISRGFQASVETYSKNTNNNLNILHDPIEAARGADAVYTDTWFNTGEIFEDNERKDLIDMLKPFQVNNKLMDECSPNAVFMHCLPAERGYEVTSDVLDDENRSIVWRQAGNRLQVQRAILELLLT